MRIFFIMISFLLCSNVYAGSNNAELITIANKLKDAVTKNDVSLIYKYIHSDGVYFMDDRLTRIETNKLLKDANSPLYRYLFGSDDSIKSYLLSAQDLKIKVHYRDKYSAIVSFASSNHPVEEWKECCFIKRNKRWYFDGIFYCE